MEYIFPIKFTQTSAPIINFLNPESKDAGDVFLDPRVFGVAIRQDIIHQIVRLQRAQIRQPQCTKRIGDIRGSTRKLYQQKGSGNARVGQLRSAIRRGGMKSHGPVLRDFSFDLNRKTKALGMMIAIAAKFREGNLLIVDKIHASVWVRTLPCSH
jgi:large subunit ribosomal protein L4